VIEAVTGGEELRLVSTVPLADMHGGVADGFQQPGHGDLRGVQADGLPGKEHKAALE